MECQAHIAPWHSRPGQCHFWLGNETRLREVCVDTLVLVLGYIPAEAQLPDLDQVWLFSGMRRSYRVRWKCVFIRKAMQARQN